MKKILIVNNNMHIGGVQKALISLLWCIRDRYDITVLLFSDTGECMDELPPDVKVITSKSAYRFIGLTKYDELGFLDKLGRTFYASVCRLFGRKFAVALMGIGQKRLEGYDVAISYLHNSGKKMFYGGCNDFVLKHVSAKTKVTFLHCDYMRCGANTLENAKQYARFDVIAACSQGCADSFSAANPSLKEKVTVVSNCHHFDRIHSEADAEPVTLAEDKVNLVTVARFGKEKGVARALRVVAGLSRLKDKIHYYIIGDGVQKPELLDIIEKENLSSCVTLCGMMDNPYGYIKAADLLLIPSYSEAAPLVIGEAACLGTPILSMETSSAREMIEQTDFGWVCENSEAAMKAALSRLLEDPLQLKNLQSHMAQRTFDNKNAVAQFENSISKNDYGSSDQSGTEE